MRCLRLTCLTRVCGNRDSKIRRACSKHHSNWHSLDTTYSMQVKIKVQHLFTPPISPLTSRALSPQHTYLTSSRYTHYYTLPMRTHNSSLTFVTVLPPSTLCIQNKATYWLEDKTATIAMLRHFLVGECIDASVGAAERRLAFLAA